MSADFDHFPSQTMAFLDGIARNNEKAWFEEHRDLYEQGYVAPGKAFVEAMAPRLRAVSPQVHAEPRVNGSIMRVNRDVRFSKDKRPYKTHLDFWFWHGDKKGWNTAGFYLRITPDQVFIGSGLHRFDKEKLDSFRHALVLRRSGQALASAIAAVGAAGDYEIGEKTRKLPPRGFAVDADRAEYLLFEGLTATKALPGAAALEPGFVDQCAQHFAATWPVGDWLLRELGDE